MRHDIIEVKKGSLVGNCAVAFIVLISLLLLIMLLNTIKYAGIGLLELMVKKYNLPVRGHSDSGKENSSQNDRSSSERDSLLKSEDPRSFLS